MTTVDFEIRPLASDDALGLATVHASSWKTTYRGIVQQSYLDKISIEQRLPGAERRANAPNMNCFVAANLKTQQIVGFVDVGVCREKNIDADGEVYALYLLQEFQGKGLGRLLFEKGVEILKGQGLRRMMVSVLQENHSSRRFYEKMGGKYIGSDHVDLDAVRYPTATYLWELA